MTRGHLPSSRTCLTGVAMLLCAVLSACEHHDHERDFFPPEHHARSIDFTLSAQASAGARFDATLYPYHFDDGRLNTLGEAKLLLALRDAPPIRPLIFYLDMPQDASFTGRRAAVERYLASVGMPGGEVELRNGINPATLTLAGPISARQARAESVPTDDHPAMTGVGTGGTNGSGTSRPPSQ